MYIDVAVASLEQSVILMFWQIGHFYLTCLSRYLSLLNLVANSSPASADLDIFFKQDLVPFSNCYQNN